MSRHVAVMGAGETLLCSPEARAFVLGVLRGMDRLADVRLPPVGRELVAALDEAARRSTRTAAAAVAAVPLEPDRSLSSADLIDTGEVARMTGTKIRNARDLCARGTFETAVRLGGSWRVSRAEVEQHIATRGVA